MKTVKQILEKKAEIENVDVVTALYENDLLNESTYKMLKRAINKDPETMTLAEKRALCEFAKTYLLEAPRHLSAFDKRFGKGWPTDKQIPPIIVLRRKAIRVFPDNQKIALYYSQALDKHISIPFDQNNKATLGVSMNEESEVEEFLITEEREEEPKMSADNVRDRFRHKLETIREEQEQLDENPVVGLAVRGAAAVGGAILKKVVPKLKKVVPKSPAKKALDAARANRLKPAPSTSTPIKPPTKSGILSKVGKGIKTGATAAAGYVASKIGGGQGNGTDNNGVGLGYHRQGAQSGDFTAAGRLRARIGNTEVSVPNAPLTAAAQRLNAYNIVNPRSPMNEEEDKSNFDLIKNLSESKQRKAEIAFGENVITINKGMAKKIMRIHESLNKTNRKKIERMLNENATTFKEVINFTMRQ